jgi:uncharacterized protein (TIGR02453 family)
VAEPLKRINKDFVADPRPNGGSMFRIHRDTRFSKDKTPYKTNAAANFRHKAGRDVAAPGFYLSLQPDGCFMGGGIWHPDTEPLKHIRDYVAGQPKAWLALRKSGLPLEGESLTRAPKGYPKDHPLEEDLRRKDFITSLAIKDKDVMSPRFVERFAEGCEKVNPLVKVLCTALGL